MIPQVSRVMDYLPVMAHDRVS